MKNITIKQERKLFTLKVVLSTLFLLTVTFINAQVQNNGATYIGREGFMYIESGSYNFGSGTVETKTERPTLALSTFGKLLFNAGASASGASDTHFLDGYACVQSTAPFVMPIGHSGVYAPVTVTCTTTSPVDAAYYRANRTTISSTIGAGVGTALDATVNLISAIEFWHITGNNTAIVSLSWRSSSALISLTSATTQLTVAGYNGTTNLWESIASTAVGGSTITAGSITSTAGVDLNTYKFFAIASKGIACGSLVASSGIIKTWNGSWSPSAPTLADPVVISAAYSNGSFACNSLVLNANVTLTNGQNLEIINGATGLSKIIMTSEASLVQRASGATVPNIELNKRTRDVMRRFDYVYWGTPISGNFFSQLAAAQASTATLPAAFSSMFRYQSGVGGGWQSLTATETGIGFITRVKEQAPFVNGIATDFINLKFTGTANNGDVIVPVARDPAAPNAGRSHVLLANPYPSAIDADKFLTDNTTVDGVVYIWTAATANAGGGAAHAQADYIVYTRAGASIPNTIPATFTGKIAAGQSFIVKSLVNAGTVTFTNCMRVTGDNNQFFRNNTAVASVEQIDRFKLNMTGTEGVFSQIVIAYLPEATLNYDRLYDAGRNSVSTAQLYSVFEENGSRLAINARPNFFDTDVVPLGISKYNTDAATFTISISDKEGIFDTGDATVYLQDTLLGTTFNLATGPYTFTTNSLSLNTRFKVVYQNIALGVDDFDNNSTMAYIKNQSFNLTASTAIKAVFIYDIVGKLIDSYQANDQNKLSAAFNHAQGVYVAKIKLENGHIATLKLINDN